MTMRPLPQPQQRTQLFSKYWRVGLYAKSDLLQGIDDDGQSIIVA